MAQYARCCGPIGYAERYRLIARSVMFAGIPACELERLTGDAHLIAAEQGETLFSAGEIARVVHLIVDGAVQVIVGRWVTTPDANEADHAGPDGSSLLLHVLGAGDVAADIELIPLLADQLSPVIRQSSGRVLTRTARVIAIHGCVLAQVLRKHPELRDRLAGRVLERMRQTQTLLADIVLARTRSKVRLARLLLDLFNRFGTSGAHGIELPMRLSHSALAQALGLARRCVFAQVNALEQSGAIDHDRTGRLTLLDVARLRRAATCESPEGGPQVEDHGRCRPSRTIAVDGGGDDRPHDE
jgi:CRP-like cAMP-binding protein